MKRRQEMSRKKKKKRASQRRRTTKEKITASCAAAGMALVLEVGPGCEVNAQAILPPKFDASLYDYTIADQAAGDMAVTDATPDTGEPVPDTAQPQPDTAQPQPDTGVPTDLTVDSQAPDTAPTPDTTSADQTVDSQAPDSAVEDGQIFYILPPG
jgi:hypothetical protein